MSGELQVPLARKKSTSSIKGQANDDFCSWSPRNHRARCGRSVTGVYYCAFMQKLHRKVHKNRPQLLVAGPLILHDNTRPLIADVVTKKLHDYGWEVLLHVLYSPNMSAPDLDVFPKLKEPMRGRRFSSLEELSTDATRTTGQMNKSGWNNNASQTLVLSHWEAGRL